MALPRGAMGCLRFVIVVFPDHTHLLLFKCPSTKVGKEYMDENFEEENHKRLRSDFGFVNSWDRNAFLNTEFVLKKVINKAIKCPYTKKYK